MFLTQRPSRWIPAGLALSLLAAMAFAQDKPGEFAGAVQPAQVQPGTPADKRVLGVFPNYRTADKSAAAVPLTAAEKLHIALKDSFDWPSYVTAAGFAALNQLDNGHERYGQGMEGFGKRYAAGVSDQIFGNMMTEGFFPMMLHEDPRYFRKADGSFKSRLGYSMTRIFVTRTDSGHARMNFSELGGNATAAAFGNLYYVGERQLGDNFSRYGTALATDMFSNVLKEFWPDIKRKLHHNSEQ